jgi:DNA polymerase-3 subunit beta
MSKPMKIHFEPKSFSPLFQLAASVAAVRDVKPILQNVKVTADKKTGVVLQATDTEIGIRIDCAACNASANGEAIFPTKRFREIVRRTGEETLDIESDENKVSVKGTLETFDMDTQSPEEFPDIEKFEEAAYHVIPAKTLKEMIRRTIFAPDTDSARYALAGVYFEMNGDAIDIVATDGKRLAWQRGTGSCVKNHKVESAIVPGRALQLFDRALGDDDEDVKVAFSANRVLFQYKHITFFSRLLEGKFPKWRNIIPDTENDKPVNIMAGTLLANVLKAEIMSTEPEPGVMFTFEKGKLTLSSASREVGKSDIQVPVSFDGAKKQIKLDHEIMTDYLQALGGEKDLSFFLPDGDAPLKITADDGTYVYVVMPMNLER